MESHHIIVILILIVFVAYVTYNIIYPSVNAVDRLKVKTSLTDKTLILESDETQKVLLGSSGSTVMGFVFIEGGDKTANYKQAYTPLFYVDQNWYLEVAPAPPGKKETSTRLRVRTNHGGQTVDEHIDVPPLPRQKWVFISILRDGRRFDVMYDNKIVASHRMQNYPAIVSSPLMVGNKGFIGSVIHVITEGKRLSPSDVSRIRDKYVDTNGTVLEGNTFNLSLPTLAFLGQCPSGLPCNPVTKPPGNNLFSWSTPYA